MPSALLFDVDGTLADTERDGHRPAFNAAFMEFGLGWEWDPDLYGALLAVTGGKEGPDPLLERLSVILAEFNKRFGTEFSDGDRIVKRIKDEIAPTVDADPDYRNARENTPQNAGLALDAALDKVMRVFLKDDIKAYKLYVENEDFNRFVHDLVLELTKGGPGPAA